MRFLFLPLLLLSGCVSLSTYNRDKDAAYHRGRIEVVWKVAGWLYEGDVSDNDLKLLVDGLKTGEFLWSCYNRSTEAQYLQWEYDLIHQKDQGK